MESRSVKTLFCFSPLVMVSTFGIEIALGVFLLWKYRHVALGRLGAATMFCLAIFQAAEYGICAAGGQRLPALIGYLAITMLPAFGVDISRRLTERSRNWAVTAYGIAGAWVLYFLLNPNSVVQILCTGNYNILTLDPVISEAYGLYYFIGLFAGLGLCLVGRAKLAGHSRAAVGWMAGAYLAIIVPTFVVNFWKPETFHGIPSIMCGFALSLALIIALRVVVLAERR